MIENLKRTFTQAGLGTGLALVLLFAAAAVGSRPAQNEDRCGVCHHLQSSSENFDEVTPPALPAGWLATNALGPPPFWVTSDTGVPDPPADTLPNAVFIDDPGEVSDKRLDSPAFTFFEECCVQLTFRQNFNLQASISDPNVGFDGGVLEASTDGGNTFQDIVAAGGSFVIGGYNRTISADRGSPIAGRQAWSGTSNGFVTTVVNVPAIQAAPGIILRWRMASDTSGASQGWRVDSVTISWCAGPPCTPKPLPTPRARPTAASRPVSSAPPVAHGTPLFTPAPRPVSSAPPSPHATPAFTPARRPSP